jgi:hypothetical protein
MLMALIDATTESGTKQRVSLVVFLGGCTFAELSALRLLGQQEGLLACDESREMSFHQTLSFSSSGREKLHCFNHEHHERQHLHGVFTRGAHSTVCSRAPTGCCRSVIMSCPRSSLAPHVSRSTPLSQSQPCSLSNRWCASKYKPSLS